MQKSNPPDVSPELRPPQGRWLTARRLLLLVATVATLVAVFYTVENWRGKRAWERSRRELEAKGEVFDWTAYIPGPVPDDQNFFKAPQMREWFVKGSMLDLLPSRAPQSASVPSPFALPPRKDTSLVVAEVSIITADAPVNSLRADTVLRFADPAGREQAAKLLRERIGPCAFGARQCLLVAQPVSQIKPLQLALQAKAVPTLKELAAFFPQTPVTNLPMAYSDVEVQPVGSNQFHILLKAPVYGAADYLSWTEPLTANFDLVRKALERPYARIDCDYEQPFAIAIPDFVRIRNVVQLLSQRAQAYLLLGQSEPAWQELSMIHDLSGVLLSKPSGKPITLISAMIDVAVAGLYASVVEDGLRLHAWREAQLAAIQRQLKATDLLQPVVEAFREERAATWRTFETTPRGELVKLFSPDTAEKLALTWIPRGWFYQNMALGARIEQDVIDTLDVTNQLVRPHLVDKHYSGLEARLRKRSPYNFLVAIAIPNFMRAVQTAARNQTSLNEARVACGLERCRLATGQYPERLEGLSPQWVESIPHDLIGGQPLKYRRSNEGGFVLYSVGWNETDDGGVAGNSREQGDWVWEQGTAPP